MRTTELRPCGTLSSRRDKQLLANQTDTVVVDREQKRAVVIDFAIPSDGNIREDKKTKKHLGLKDQLEQVWKSYGSG